MNIAPLSPRPPEISVAEPITPAYERVKQMLFRPFDLGKWFTIGFCAWLAALGEAGGFNGGSFNNGSNHHYNNGSSLGETLQQGYYQSRDYVLSNIAWIAPLAIFVVLLTLTLWVVMVWLSSRGKLMFLHCIATNKAEVQQPWTHYAGVANSLCWFRLGLGVVGMVVMLPLMALIAIIILKMVMAGEANAPAIMLAVGLFMVFLLLAVVFGIIQKFLEDFVVTILFLRGGTCCSAWREFGGLLMARPGQFALYILFQIVLAMVIGTLVLFAVLLTCCIAGCVMALPYVGTVLLLPVLIFKRSYALYYLAQYGPQYDVFPKLPPPPPAPSALVPLVG